MAKVDITFEFDSIRELGELMYSLGQTEANDFITDIWVDLVHKKEEAQTTDNHRPAYYDPESNTWAVYDGEGYVIRAPRPTKRTKGVGEDASE